MIDLLEAIENSRKDEAPECAGVIYRADVFHGPTSRGVVLSIRLNKLKRKSCPGCSKCIWIDEYIAEVNSKYPLLNIENVVDGKLYTVEMCNISKDWETGYVDDYDLRVVEVGDCHD